MSARDFRCFKFLSFVTGPHLHMRVRWNEASLDPTPLLAMTLPETGKAKAAEHAKPVRTWKPAPER